ncbi:MAG: hypothetical protein JXM73_24635 [Anaerolineae bacterium]|nr:hypothetical protein [Anaerolineae bacterium]
MMKGIPTTRRRFALVIAVAILLLVSTAASAGPGGGYSVQEGTIAGGGYRLTSVGPPVGEAMICAQVTSICDGG